MLKHLFVIVFCLLIATPALATITAVGDLGSATSPGNNNATGVITTSATLEAGNQAIVLIAIDNHNTSDGDHNEVTAVTDSASNTYSEICGEQTNDGEAALQSGVTLSVWLTRASTQLTSGGTITASFAHSTTVDVFAMRAFEFSATSALEVAGSCQLAVGDDADPPEQSISGLSSAETLFLRATGEENGTSGDWTPTTNYTSMVAVTDSRNGTTGLGMRVMGEYRIATATGDTSNPSDVNDGDTANIYVALREGGATAIPASPIFFP